MIDDRDHSGRFRPGQTGNPNGRPKKHNGVDAAVTRALQEKRVSMWLVWPASLGGVLAMSFAIAYAMHIVIERPSLRLREWLSS